jgi:hypothetical protein
VLSGQIVIAYLTADTINGDDPVLKSNNHLRKTYNPIHEPGDTKGGSFATVAPLLSDRNYRRDADRPPHRNGFP